VVGHVEWVQFASVQHVPAAGEVVHASGPFEEPAGGGAVAAVQLARLAGGCVLLTALGSDGHGDASIARLGQLGVEVHAARLAEPTRRAITLLDAHGERTITTLGSRLEPRAGAGAGGAQPGVTEPAPGWELLHGRDAVYFTAGDAAALRLAREGARVLVASPRAGAALREGVRLDALVLSGDDRIEQQAADGLDGSAEVVVRTEGGRGGSYVTASGASGRWQPAELDAPALDSYGCGDSFAAGLTYGLAAGMHLEQALALAARCGAVCLTGRGPYGRQLQADALG
jgi:ribokinase